MRLIKNMKRGAAKLISANGGLAASFDKRTLTRVRIHFEADNRFFRYCVELDKADAESLRDNLNHWLEESDNGNG